MEILLQQKLRVSNICQWHWLLGQRESTDAILDEHLELLQPGLILRDESEQYEVPRAIFYPWMQAIAERLLRKMVTSAELHTAQLDCLIRAVALIGPSGELPSSSPSNEEGTTSDWASEYYMLAATLNTVGIMGGSLPQGVSQGTDLIKEMFSWASKRHIGNRHYATTTAELANKAAQLHGKMTAYQNTNDTSEEAITTERMMQLDTFVSCWQAYLDSIT